MLSPEEEQKFDDVYTAKFLPRLFAKANDDVISILLNQVKNERSLLNLDRDKISLFRWLIELLGHVARSVNRDSIGISVFEKRVTLMHTHSLIVKFLNDTQMTSEQSNDIERVALMEASMYTIQQFARMSHLCSNGFIQESAVPYLTWLLASSDKTLSDAALSTLCVLNERHVETSFLLICHDGIPTLVDMIYHNNSVKAKSLYLTCRSNIPTSLSLLRLRDTRMYVVFERENLIM